MFYARQLRSKTELRRKEKQNDYDRCHYALDFGKIYQALKKREECA